MGCPKHIVDAGLCPEANAKKAKTVDANGCVKALGYVNTALQRQNQYYAGKRKFGTLSEIGLGAAPNPTDYSYTFQYIGTNYCKFTATPVNDAHPFVVGYIYLQKHGQSTIVRKFTQLSYTKKHSVLISSDVAQPTMLTVESGFQLNCK